MGRSRWASALSADRMRPLREVILAPWIQQVNARALVGSDKRRRDDLTWPGPLLDNWRLRRLGRRQAAEPLSKPEVQADSHV
jgi:hypothetical protein